MKLLEKTVTTAVNSKIQPVENGAIGTPDAPTIIEAMPVPAKLGTKGRIAALIMAMRPKQWIKNLSIFVGIVFAQRLLTVASLERAVLAFAAFCAACSIIYLLNDLLDLENDRQHPIKRNRPLASGKLPVSWAITWMGVLALICVALTGSIYAIPIASKDFFASLGGSNVLFTLT